MIFLAANDCIEGALTPPYRTHLSKVAPTFASILYSSSLNRVIITVWLRLAFATSLPQISAPSSHSPTRRTRLRCPVDMETHGHGLERVSNSVSIATQQYLRDKRHQIASDPDPVIIATQGMGPEPD